MLSLIVGISLTEKFTYESVWDGWSNPAVLVLMQKAGDHKVSKGILKVSEGDTLIYTMDLAHLKKAIKMAKEKTRGNALLTMGIGALLGGSGLLITAYGLSQDNTTTFLIGVNTFSCGCGACFYGGYRLINYQFSSYLADRMRDKTTLTVIRTGDSLTIVFDGEGVRYPQLYIAGLVDKDMKVYSLKHGIYEKRDYYYGVGGRTSYTVTKEYINMVKPKEKSLYRSVWRVALKTDKGENIIYKMYTAAAQYEIAFIKGRLVVFVRPRVSKQ